MYQNGFSHVIYNIILIAFVIHSCEALPDFIKLYQYNIMVR